MNMKIDSLSVAIISSVLGVFIVVGVVAIQQVFAQVDATSTETVATSPESENQTDVYAGTSATTTDTETVTPSEATTDTTTDTTTETQTEISAEDGTASDTETATPESVTPTEAPPEGLTEIHIIGTKYIDYFTDGTTEFSFPGDPEIHAHIAEKDAPIPTHEGLTWVHSVGNYLYDTESGDLEVGQYAVQPEGSFISKGFPFVSSTSTPAAAGSSSTTEENPAPSPEVLGASTSSDASSSTIETSPAVSETDTPASTNEGTPSDATTPAPEPTSSSTQSTQN